MYLSLHQAADELRLLFDQIDPETGEVYLDSGGKFTAEVVDKVLASRVKDITYLKNPHESLILTSLADPGARSDT